MKKSVTMVVEEERLIKLREIARAEERSLSYMIRRAIDEYIDARQAKEKERVLHQPHSNHLK